MAIPSTSNPGERPPRHGRNPLLLLGGAIMITAAMALLLFGSDLLGSGENGVEHSLFEQIPESENASTGVVVVPVDRLIEVGDVSLDFELRGLDDEIVGLSMLRGQPVVLNFWATWCAPCRIEMPELQAAFEQHQEDGLVILAIDFDEPAEVVRAFFYDEMGLTFTPLLDVDGVVAASYGVFNFPTTFFIDPEGIVQSVHRGPMVRQQIDDHLSKIIPASR